MRRELGPKEDALWIGGPASGIKLRAHDTFLIPFSIMWCGFAIFWEASVVLTKAPFFFRLWGIPFVLVGLYLVIGRFFADAWFRSRVAYAVTTERVLISWGGRVRGLKSIDLQSLNDMTIEEASDGTGTILFGPAPVPSRNKQPWGPSADPQNNPAFEFIPNARRVYELIREGRRKRLDENARRGRQS